MYYFAYGSNLNMKQMKIRCPEARPVGWGPLKDHRLAFKRLDSDTDAYLTIEQAKGCFVPIGVWEISGNDETQLDRYEGYPELYIKEIIHLEFNVFDMPVPQTGDGIIYRMCEASVYDMPSAHYLKTCLEGYRDFDFPYLYIEEAYRRARKEAIRRFHI